MTHGLSFAHIAALVVGAVACGFDVRTRRIPNALTFGAAGAAIVFHAVAGGVSGVTSSVLGWMLGVALVAAPFVLGGMGAGDVKLVAALGAWLGPPDTFWLAMFTGIAGALIALLLATARGYLRQALRNLWLLLAYWRLAGVRPMSELTLETAKGPRLAYAFSIFAGMVATLWLR
jgi:prepilin peptidase CpaA